MITPLALFKSIIPNTVSKRKRIKSNTNRPTITLMKVIWKIYVYILHIVYSYTDKNTSVLIILQRSKNRNYVSCEKTDNLRCCKVVIKLLSSMDGEKQRRNYLAYQPEIQCLKMFTSLEFSRCLTFELTLPKICKEIIFLSNSPHLSFCTREEKKDHIPFPSNVRNVFTVNHQLIGEILLF